MTSFPTRRGLLGAAGGLALAAPAFATTPGWPSQNLRLVVPFTPGGSNDNFARPVAEALQASLGRPVVVENRPGAAGSIGAAFVAAAPADGHTLLLASSSFSTSSTIRRTSFDALESFDAVARLCTAPMVVVTKPNSPFRTMDELVRHARANPGKLLYGMAGMGGVGHFAMEAFNLASRLQMEAIPYAGIAPAQSDLVSGRIDFLMTTLASVRGLVEAGTVPVIAVSTAGRVPSMPGIPTIRESTGLDYEVTVWWGILAPRGVPLPVRERLNAEIGSAVRAPSYLRFLELEGAQPAPLGLAEFSSALRADILRWRQVAADARISVN